VRIIDENRDAAPYSRALGVQARTLEYYQQAGIAQRAVDGGIQSTAVNFSTGGKRRAHVPIGVVGEGLTRYPYVLDYAQNDHERMLIDELHALGVHVERSTELASFEQDASAVHATVKHAGGSAETIVAAYIAGCDGARSVVRETLKIGFPGGTYTHLFYVADVLATGSAVNGEVHVDLEESDLLAVFGMRGDGHVRLVGTIQQGARKENDITFNDVAHDVIRRMKITVRKVDWFSTYRVHHRVAERFSEGRAFLLGDAAHIHSPVGAQGMNTGIGDAINLAWKLADVLKGGVQTSRLHTYSVERMAFARRLVRTTDAVFTFASNPGPVAAFARKRLMPIAANVTRLRSFRRFLFRTVSQLGIHYRMSALSRGRAGSIHGGDRLPWIERATSDGHDNFAVLASLRWQVHVYGRAIPQLAQRCTELTLPLYEFAWSPSMRRAGFQRDAAYLVRPDGYVALAVSSKHGVELLNAYAMEFLNR
jgi:2-polyprenyl-6-methoxyphenol hydroxylase-like FAD-dependent oxidoreductase